ncbi:MAG: polymer-forming cytoskeletal protein [Ferruginibacter sp.]|jgi:cytoskeletal protein CcmA (bactofilin family)
MFTSKSANREKTAVSLSLIGPGTIITGNLESAGDIRIDGVLKGNLHCQSKILIGPDGSVEGDIHGKQADIMGTVHGNISMTGLLYLHGNANIEGDIHAGQLQIDPAVSFNGQCKMGANVVEMNTAFAPAVNE